jgi:DNA mismatch repair protein MLH3
VTVLHSCSCLLAYILSCIDTSKYPPRASLHGRHGTFLASVGSLSLLCVSSHHSEFRSQNSLTIHNSKVVARNIPALPDQELRSHPSGTRVSVRDLFGSMPVRVRQRSVDTERLGSAKDYDQLLHSIVSLLLAWPTQITVTARDVSSRRVVSLHAPRIISQELDRKLLNDANCWRAARLLSQALLQTANLESWVSVGASTHGVSVTGCVCLQPVATKCAQYLALGVRPLSNELQANALYEEVNNVFSHSSFGADEDIPSPSTEATAKAQGLTKKTLKIRKRVEKWPMFFLQINLEGKNDPLDSIGFSDKRHGNLAAITGLLRVTAYEFLKRHHFRPRSVHAFEELEAARGPATRIYQEGKRSKAFASSEVLHQSRRLPHSTRNSTSNPSGTHIRASRSTSTLPFASWSRLKLAPVSGEVHKGASTVTPSSISLASGSDEDQSSSTQAETADTKTWKPMFSKSGLLLRKPFDDEEGAPVCGPSVSSHNAQEPNPSPNTEGSGVDTMDNIAWIEPTTKIRAVVDARTGFMVNPKPACGMPSQSQNLRTEGSVAIRQKSSVLSQSRPVSKNQIFSPNETVIPRVPQIPDLCLEQHGTCRSRHNFSRDIVGAPGGEISKTLQSTISRDALRIAEVIRQVDRKYILVKVPTERLSSNSEDARVDAEAIPRPMKLNTAYTLVLIDQHAADERCRVEELMKDYFDLTGDRIEARIEILPRALRFDLSSKEGELLDLFRQHFQHWGIRYELFNNGNGDTAPGKQGGDAGATVEVYTLPPSVAERCRLEPRLLVELLRREVWKLNDGRRTGPVGLVSVSDGGEHDWAARFLACPKGLLDLINSRSCRSKSPPCMF